jgi:methylglyoxal synthase
MTTLVLKIKDKKQLIALMDVVQRYKIPFSGNMDETEFLLSTDENRESLERSLKQAEEGKTRAIKTSDLWK